MITFLWLLRHQHCHSSKRSSIASETSSQHWQTFNIGKLWTSKAFGFENSMLFQFLAHDSKHRIFPYGADRPLKIYRI